MSFKTSFLLLVTHHLSRACPNMFYALTKIVTEEENNFTSSFLASSSIIKASSQYTEDCIQLLLFLERNQVSFASQDMVLPGHNSEGGFCLLLVENKEVSSSQVWLSSKSHSTNFCRSHRDLCSGAAQQYKNKATGCVSVVTRAPLGKGMYLSVPAANITFGFGIKHSLKKTYTHL